MEILQCPFQALGIPPCWGLLCSLGSACPWKSREKSVYGPQTDLDLTADLLS